MATKIQRPTHYSTYNTAEKEHLFNPENQKLLKGFLKYCNAQGKSKETIKQYDNKISIFFVWLLQEKDNKSFVDIEKTDILEWQSDCMSNDKSSSTIRQCRAALSSFSKYIEDILDKQYPSFKNIINKIPAPKLEYMREKTYISEENFDLLKQELKKREEWQLLAYLALTYDAASRKSESFQVSKDINWSKYETKVVKGKGNKKFAMPFSKETGEYIKKWLSVRGEDACDSLFVVKTIKGTVKQISKNTINNWCKRLSEIYKEITGEDVWIFPHALKHCRISSLYNDDKLSLETVQEFAHHSSSQTTLNNYIEKRPNAINEKVFGNRDDQDEKE